MNTDTFFQQVQSWPQPDLAKLRELLTALHGFAFFAEHKRITHAPEPKASPQEVLTSLLNQINFSEPHRLWLEAQSLHTLTEKELHPLAKQARELTRAGKAPRPNFENLVGNPKFEPLASEIIPLAEKIAKQFGWAILDSELVLLALLDQPCSAEELFLEQGLSKGDVKRILIDASGSPNSKNAAPASIIPGLIRNFQQTAELANSLNRQPELDDLLLILLGNGLLRLTQHDLIDLPRAHALLRARYPQDNPLADLPP